MARRLHYRALAMPAGRASMQMTLASQGRSASALTGALVRQRHRDAGIRCASPVSIRAPSMSRSAPATPARRPTTSGCARSSSRCCRPARCRSRRRKFRSRIRDGRLRVGATTLDADVARAIISGGYDIPADQADIRADPCVDGGRTGDQPSGNSVVRGGFARCARSHRRRGGAVVMAGGEGDRSRNPPAGFDRARRAAAGIAGVDSAACGRPPQPQRRMRRSRPRSATLQPSPGRDPRRPLQPKPKAACRARRLHRQCQCAGRQPAGRAAAAADRGPPGARRAARRRSRGRRWC